tara:strand:- start:1745 stop:2569 length:825 start_codon:yes stop_codon:yes gene_type:complete
LLLPLYSFSYEFGYTSNAALYGNTWKMNTGTLGISAEEGLDISGVLYNYTAVKNKVDDFTVTIENDKVGGGYVFQDTEDWSGKYGGKVQNVIPLPYTPIEQFGDGRIRGTGTGSIEDVTILYMYRWDLCRNAQNDESCPNYIPPLPVIPKIEIYDALDDEYVAEATDETDSELYDKEVENKESTEEDEEEERLEIALASSGNALTIANTATQSAILQSMNIATNINSYYVANIPSTVYRDTISLQDKDIVDNRLVFRSLTQEQLHNEMVQEQYK